MSKTMLDGWHTISGEELYIEGGTVLRGIKTDSNGGRVTAYPYRRAKGGGWDKDTNMTVSAYRAGVARGTVSLK